MDLELGAAVAPLAACASGIAGSAQRVVGLSDESTWEVLLLHARGRIDLSTSPQNWLAAATANLREAPLTHEIVRMAYHLALPHQDPADRFLAATAAVLGLILVTSDTRLLGLGDIATLANR